jgi:DNA modification methylase
MNEIEGRLDCESFLTQSGRRGGGIVQIRNRVRELRLVRASQLLPNRKNWRRHPAEQAAALRGLLAEIGYADVLIARDTPDGLVLIDGHLRAETTPNMMVPVVIVDLTEDEADKLLLTGDALTGMAVADAKQVQALLATLQFENESIGALLENIAGEAALAAINSNIRQEAPEPQIDRAAELQRKWKTRSGQHWKINSHHLIIGGSTEPAVVSRLFAVADSHFRMVWTDPPYGVNYASKNEYLNQSDRGNRIQRPIANDDAENAHALLGNALSIGRKWALPGAVAYASVPSGSALPNFIDAFNTSGFNFRHLLVWVKNQFVIGMSDYHHRFEVVLYGWLCDAGHYWAGSRSQDNVFEIDRPHISDLHPMTKPVELVEQMIANSSRPTEGIYDPFCGSGTTLVACERLGRIGYGVEIDPAYAAVTLERLSSLNLTPELVE